MTDPANPVALQRIFHPTDFSPGSQVAFVHALKLAMLARAELTIMHVDPTVTPEGFEDFPRVRPILEKWGALPPGSAKEQVASLGLRIKKIRALANDPKAALVHHLTQSRTDLMILSTSPHQGRFRWIREPEAEVVSRAAEVPTLFVPSSVEGFVSLENGRTGLHHILLPISRDPSPVRPIEFATMLATLTGGDKVTFELAHSEDRAGLPPIETMERPGWTWHMTVGAGNAVDWILASGAEYDVDLIVMSTKGHDSLLDSLLGSTTERVLHGARCPVLAIPV
jgi:nucleotide-binding universal stress UspA family protein